MSGVTIISLPTTVSVSTGALGLAHHQLRTLCFTLGQTGDLYEPLSFSNEQVERRSRSEGGEVSHLWVVWYVANIGGPVGLVKGPAEGLMTVV